MYQRKRNINLRTFYFDLLPFKNDAFCGKKKLGQKINWDKKFFKVDYLNGLNRETYNIGQPIFFLKKPKIFNCLIAWLYCLDELEKFASQFYL